MEALGRAEERWPTDIVEAREAAMLARLGEVEADLAPLRARVKSARHPWWWVMMGIIALGAFASLMLWQADSVLVWPVAVAAIGGAIWAGIKASGFQKILDAARSGLDAKLLGHVLHVNETPATREALVPYEEAGFIGRWEDIKRLEGYDCDGRGSLFAHLTRTETTTDSKGNTQTRTVTVFRGLLFTLPFSPAEGDAVTILRRGGSARAKGRFERLDPTGRRRKLEPIKTSSLEFNRRHKITTTDPVIAHAIFDPDRTMRFIQMEHDLSDTVSWGRSTYAMLMTRERAWVAISGLDVPRPEKFPEGDKLAKQLQKVFLPLSLPSVIGHHLRLPATQAATA